MAVQDVRINSDINSGGLDFLVFFPVTFGSVPLLTTNSANLVGAGANVAVTRVQEATGKLFQPEEQVFDIKVCCGFEIMGYFTLQSNGQTSGPIYHNAPAVSLNKRLCADESMQGVLQAFPNVVAPLTATRTAYQQGQARGVTYKVTFTNNIGDVPQFTIASNNLCGREDVGVTSSVTHLSTTVTVQTGTLALLQLGDRVELWHPLAGAGAAVQEYVVATISGATNFTLTAAYAGPTAAGVTVYRCKTVGMTTRTALAGTLSNGNMRVPVWPVYNGANSSTLALQAPDPTGLTVPSVNGVCDFQTLALFMPLPDSSGVIGASVYGLKFTSSATSSLAISRLVQLALWSHQVGRAGSGTHASCSHLGSQI
jgi:hypothetical protein